MLGYKLAHAEVIKFAMDENKRLKQERAALLGELEASLSPEMAQHVEKIIDRRGSFMPDDGLTPSARPKPVHRDGAAMDEPMGSALEVCTQHEPPLARALLRFASSRAPRAGAHADGRGSTGACFGRASCSSGAGSSQRCTPLSCALCRILHSHALVHAGIGEGSNTRTSRGPLNRRGEAA